MMFPEPKEYTILGHIENEKFNLGNLGDIAERTRTSAASFISTTNTANTAFRYKSRFVSYNHGDNDTETIVKNGFTTQRFIQRIIMCLATCL